MLTIAHLLRIVGEVSHPSATPRCRTLCAKSVKRVFRIEEKVVVIRTSSVHPPPAANQILGGGDPLRELKLETSFEKTTGDDAAALEHQFCFRTQKDRAYLQHPACGRQPDGGAPRLSWSLHEFPVP